MKSRILAILLFISSVGIAQVPNTETFTLDDVRVVLGLGSTASLNDCFSVAFKPFFDTRYDSIGYAPARSLKRFRNYKAFNLGFDAYVAPDGFNPNTQPVNIFQVYREYFAINGQAKWIYTVTDATTKTRPTGGTSYRYGYTLSGTDYQADLASGDSVMWAVGATKKWVIANHTSMTAISCYMNGTTLPSKTNQGSEWLYCGKLINNINARYNQTLKYIYIDDVNNITQYTQYGHQYNILTGTLHLSINTPDQYGYAFYECQYITGTITIPDEWTSVGDFMFTGCSGVNSLVLGNNVTKIGARSFRDCTGIDGEVEYPSTLDSIGIYAFQNCTKLDIVSFNSGLQKIGNSAFQNCTDLDCPLTLPSSLTSIGTLAFFGCAGLNCTLDIPSGLTGIGEGAFANTNFTAITESNSNYLVSDNVLYQLSPDTLALHSVKSATDEVTILSNCELIGDYCFYNNLRTDTLVIPDNVTRIGDYSFCNCDGFTALDLETVTSELVTIETYAFENCGEINGTLNIPNSVTTIMKDAFSLCVKIDNLILGNNVITIGDDAFSYMSQLTGNIVIPNTTTTIGNSAFRYDGILSGTITLGSSLSTIGVNAFFSCPLTGTLSFPSTITSIGVQSFAGNKFDSIYSAATGYTVYDYTLYDEKTGGLIKAHTGAGNRTGTLTIKSGTTSVLEYCFSGSDKRSGKLAIPYTVTQISQASFSSCTSFNDTIIIGDCINESNLNAIGIDAFNNCSGVTSWKIYDSSAPGCALSSFGNYAKPLYVQTDATGYNVTPATVAAPWTNTAIFSSVSYSLCP